MLLARLNLMLGWAALLAGLVLPVIAPGAGNIITLVLMVWGLIVLLRYPAARILLRQPTIVAVLIAGAILFATVVLTATSALHLAAILILAPLWLIGPHGALLRPLAHRLTPTVIAVFALAGTAAGALVAAIDVLVLGQERGGWLVNNPIHHADLTLMLGFVALAGVTAKSRKSLIFLLGPVLALIAIWFSGSRGPLLAFGPMLVIGGGTLAILLLPARRAVLLVAGGIAGLALAGIAIQASGMAGRLASVGEIGALFTGSSADASANERLDMLESAVSAFWASPLYGHGLLDYTAAAERFLPAGHPYGPWGHLHSDLADFAVIGGSLGLLSYALLLLAPLLGGLKAQGRWRGAAIYLGVVTPTGYVSMGLTNAMFGILAQTTLYAVVLSLIATLSFEGKDTPP